MSAAENNSEEDSADPNTMHSTNQVQMNQFVQPLQSSYWIPENNSMGSIGMPYGFYGYAPFPMYDTSMMPTSMMPMGLPNWYNAPPHQNHQPYLPIQQFQPQMFMPPSPSPMMFYNPMFAGNQHFIVNSNHTANSTSVQDSVPRSLDDGVLENPLSTDTSSKVTSIQSPIDDADLSRICQTQFSVQEPVCESSSNGALQNSTLPKATEDVINDPRTAPFATPFSTKDTSFFETENSSSQDTTPEDTNNQSFVNKPPMLSERNMSSSENPRFSLTPGVTAVNGIDLPNTTRSTELPQTLDCSTHVSPTESSPVPRSSVASSNSTPADTTKNPQRRRYRRCRCLNCRADYNQRRFPNGKLKHICSFRDCGRVFHRPWELKKHVKWHAGRRYFCAQCMQGFGRKIDLSTHIESHEKFEPSDCQNLNRKSRGDKTSTGRGQYKCNIPNCGKVFSRTWTLKIHLRCHRDNSQKNFTCQYCDRVYARKGMMDNHVKKVHMTEPSEPEYANFNDRPASSCSVREASPQEIDINFNLESSSKYACQFEKCGKVYASFIRLREHTKFHFVAAPSPPYVCRWPSCGREFTRLSYLQAHQVVHTEEKK